MCIVMRTSTLRASASFLSAFVFSATATSQIYTLSLHDALPILAPAPILRCPDRPAWPARMQPSSMITEPARSEEHTSELQSHSELVCRLLLEKKNKHRPSQRCRRTAHLPRRTRRAARRLNLPRT